MARLIDADAVWERYNKEYRQQDIYDGMQDKDWLERCVNEAPTIDAVPVVRCKDCVNSRELTKGEKSYFVEGAIGCRCFYAAMLETDFCSYGKRKDGE